MQPTRQAAAITGPASTRPSRPPLAPGPAASCPSSTSTPRWLAPQADDAAGRRRPRPAAAGPSSSRAAVEALRARAASSGAEHGPGDRQKRPAVPADADPRLADLERGELLLLRQAGLGRAVSPRLLGLITRPAISPRRPAGGNLVLGGLFGAPKAGDARGLARRGRLLEPAYRRGRRQGRLPRRRPAPLRGRRGGALRPSRSRRCGRRDAWKTATALRGSTSPSRLGLAKQPQPVAFEQGIGGQVRELRDAYRYLIANRGRLNLKSAYWFSWKDCGGPATSATPSGSSAPASGSGPSLPGALSSPSPAAAPGRDSAFLG